MTRKPRPLAALVLVSAIAVIGAGCGASTPTGTERGDCWSSPAYGCKHMSTEVLSTPPATATPLAAVKRVAILPAYNEERNIGRVIDELRALDPGLDVVVVSDGSRSARSLCTRYSRIRAFPFDREKATATWLSVSSDTRSAK